VRRNPRRSSPAAAALALAGGIVLALAPGAGAVADAGERAALRNGGFDRGLTGWRGHRAALSVVRGGPDGRAVRVAGRPGRRGTSSIYSWPRPVVSTAAGSTYRAGAWVRGRPGHRLCLRVRELSGANRTVARAERCLVASGRWQRFRPLGYRARRDGSRLGVEIATRRSPAGRVFRADLIELRAVTKPTASPGAAAPRREALGVGVHFHGLWGTYDDAQRLEVIDRMADAGLQWLRVDISWCSFEGASGDVNPYWTGLLDRVVDAATSRGLDVLGNVICTPAWATDCPDCSWEEASARQPTDPAHFGSFMRRMAERYRGRIAAWEVWNEPNEFNHQFWRGSAADYVRLLLRPAHTAIEEADPSATVVTGGTSYADAEWIEALYAAGGRGLFDALGVHPYMAPWNLPPETDNGTKWTIAHLAAIREVMERHGDESPVWLTELGWSSSLPAYPQGVTEAQQADYTVRAVELVRERFPYVTRMFFYNDRDRTSGHPRENGFGLLRNDLSPKPVYTALGSLLAGS
jgi:hypothetical protein